ncbi:MAG: CinA family protein [Rhodoluna sp.]
MIAAEQILEALRSAKKKLVIAESLTGGLLTAEFAKVAGASDVLLTGIVAYDTRLKHQLLGVSSQLLENQGAVDPEVAAQMAEGLRVKIAIKLGLDLSELVAMSTTGVAGPTEQDGKPVGELYICVSKGPEGQVSSNVFAHQIEGDRAKIQETAVLLGLGHLWEEIAE